MGTPPYRADALLAPETAAERLAASADPLLIGVRHHSPACAAAMTDLLERFAPDRILIELPVELGPWLRWLGHPELKAPVALAGVTETGDRLAFYPFADFSPELVAVRWAVAHGVTVEAFDLPLASRPPPAPPRASESAGTPNLLQHLLRVASAPEPESLWDQLVEARALGADAEAVRRAALMVGWAMRADSALTDDLDAVDLAREAFMRSRIEAARSAAERTVAVVGAFHGPALLAEPLLWSPPETDPPGPREAKDPVVSLIPYAFELLDSRSGYPAGIRDPVWQQRFWQALRDGGDLKTVMGRCLTEVVRRVRAAGHPSGVPDASEAMRVAYDLAGLRGLPGPGRRELLEAVQTTMSQGELLGRGRVLARALEATLVGRQRGRLAAGTPRSGLLPHTEALLKSLRLPGPEAASADPVELRLDPLRSNLDRRRHVALSRLLASGAPYGHRIAGESVANGQTITVRWRVQWSPRTEAMLELAGTRGVTLAQAAQGALRAEETRLRDDEAWTPTAQLAALQQAAECGLPPLVAARFEALMGPFLGEAKLGELLTALDVIERTERGHVPALLTTSEGDEVPGEIFRFAMPASVRPGPVIAAAVRAVEGMAGTTDPSDADALLELVELFLRRDIEASMGDGRLGWALAGLAREGGPLMQGAAGAALVAFGRHTSAEFGTRIAGWLDGATNPEAHEALRARLQGALIVAASLFEADPAFCQALLDRVDALSDADFLGRLSPLRGGFEVLSPASRQRLLEILGERLQAADGGGALDLRLEASPATLARFGEAERAGRAALEAIAPPLERQDEGSAPPLARASSTAALRAPTDHAISPRDRWRLILGREQERLSGSARRASVALEEMYGHGHGEGAHAIGGGSEPAFPSVREWSGELEALFGEHTRQEVLARAAEERPEALLAIDPDHVRPSIELLEQVLALKGGLGEGQLAHLRRLVDRVVSALVAALAVRVRPALVGLSTPRPTSRPTGPLDLRRTVVRNLRTARRRADDTVHLVPERFVFRTRGRRSLDWHVVLVVDVSGSMEASVIYSAMMAAIFNGLPAVTAHFLAFNTQVIDLSDRVDDPLSLLLEVDVGGGTNIARALSYARASLRVPHRTLVLVVTDFEEGGPVGRLLEEVRALVETGARPLGIAALDDRGQPRYSAAVAERVVACGMPVAALTPLALAQWVADQIR